MRDIFTTADILVPHNISKEKWSTIACDQFSSEKEYWERVREVVGDEPSTLNMIIPEAYLEEIDEEEELKKIHTAMHDVLGSSALKELKDSFVYVERTQPDGRVRKGMVGVIDLEEYDFSGTDSAIRASELTILDRLPARVRVRQGAALELPHIITFVDDIDATVIEPVSEIVDKLTLVYDFDLMEGGGHIKGWQVAGSDAEKVMAALRTLHEKDDMLMVMGDGNHSLAAAKVFWDELKPSLSEAERETHPARRALLEVNNVYDSAITFEAIHRVFFNTDAAAFVSEFEKAMPKGDDYVIQWVSKDGSGEVGVKADCIGDMLVLMQDFVDEYVEKNGGIQDYIHGDESTKKLAEQDRAVGLILPSMDKAEFFETVSKSGVFPRKSFSVGHAQDKRYYLECRKIVTNKK